MARYIDADKLIEMLNNKSKIDYEMGLYNHGALTQSFVTFVERQPTADVAPKSEITKILFDLKRQIHDKAVRPHSAGIDAYISLKVFDAVLQNIINKYTEDKK